VSRVSPRLHTSAEGPYGSPWSLSGDMYTAVPTKEWALPRLAGRGPGSSLVDVGHRKVVYGMVWYGKGAKGTTNEKQRSGREPREWGHGSERQMGRGT